MSGAAILVGVVVVAAFGLLVVVHELGHFFAARLCGMRVERFSVGFGPVLARFTRGETEWAVSAIPFGGYVRIAGMAPGEEVVAGDRAFYANQPAWRRFAVIVAGPAMNWVAAVVLAFGMLLGVGFPTPESRAVVGQVIPGGAAERAGLRTGDRVVALDGRPVATWTELVAAVVASPGRPLAAEVDRGGEKVAVTLTPDDGGGRGRIGVTQGAALRHARGIVEAAGVALAETNTRAWQTVSGLGQVFTGRQKAELRGPVGIAQDMARSARLGVAPFLAMVWFISVVLAMFNLLPIPALDGGRLVFLAYEIVTRRRVNERVESFVHMAGFVALFGLILAVTVFGDLGLGRLFRR